MSHDHAAHGHGGAHGAGQGGYTHAGHGYGGAPKGYAVQHSAADENRRGREEGETLHYALYTVFARSGARPAESNTDEARAEFEKVAEQLAADGVTLRGIYDVSAMRDNADVMIWTHGGAHGAGQGGYTHAGHGYGGAPKGYAVQHSAADENRRGREEGETLHYALYTVFARSGARPAESNTDEARAEFEKVAEQLAADGVTLRGIYDVSAMRDNADVMIWTHGATPEKLQAAVRKIRRTALFAGTTIVWSTMGVHREAEFTRNHAPAYARGKAPEAWVCVYPFVRSYDWYYMNPERRAEMLKNHGMKAIDFPQILANTVATFGMNDYEWVLALEAPQLVDLVDMMRHFRNTEARLHVREETPFYTGRRIGADEVAEVLA